MSEVITILEAEVAENSWQLLKDTYAERTAKLPESVKQTFLLQSQSQPQIWRILTHWRSQEDLDAMRSTVAVPVGVQIFAEVGAKPNLDIWNLEILSA